MALPTTLADWDCRNNRLAWLALQHDGMMESIAALLTRTARAGWRSWSAPRPPASARPRKYARLQDGHFPPTSSARASIPAFARRLRRGRDRLRGPCITVATACSSSAKGVRAGRAPDRARLADAALVGGVDTCAAACCTASTRSAWCRRGRASRSMRAAMVFRWAKPAVSPSSERAGPGERGLQLRGYGEISDAHHMSAPHPKASARSWRCARRCNAPGSGRRHRLPEPARHRDPGQRQGRGARGRGPVPAVAACLLDQRAGPGTRWAQPASSNRRSRCSRSNTACCRACWAAANDQQQPAAALRQRAARGRVRDEQFLRLRRQQLLAGVREGGMSSLRAGIAGIGYWANGPAGLERRASRSRRRDASGKRRNLRRNCWRQNERRRAPESVAVALEVALAACTASGRDPSTLPSVFASTHGDLAITDYVASTLAERTARAVADQVPQLGAQRRRRLLDHRQRLHRADHGDFRLRRELRAGIAGSAVAARLRARRRCCSRPSMRPRPDRWPRCRPARACSAPRWCWSPNRLRPRHDCGSRRSRRPRRPPPGALERRFSDNAMGRCCPCSMRSPPAATPRCCTRTGPLPCG